MRKFIFKTLSFIGIIIIVFMSVVFVSRHFSKISIDEKRKILILGHSHSECAYNDSIISDVANMSQSGESYFYCYFKTRLIVDHNPGIKTVLIEFTNNQIDQSMNDWIYGEYMSYRFPKYFAFLDWNSLLLLARKNPKTAAMGISPAIKYNINNIVNGFKINDLGGFLYLKRYKTDSMLAARPANFTIPEIRNQLSEYNLEYLRRIIDYLTGKNIKVYLIRSPLHKEYEGYGNERQYQEIIKTRFSSVEFLDFSRFPASNEEFGDLQHLNHKGAKKFSSWFNHLINQGMLTKSNKQQFIDKEISLLSSAD